MCRLARSRALWEIPQGSVVRVGCRACGASERVPGVRHPSTAAAYAPLLKKKEHPILRDPKTTIDSE